jgi:tetratricopeptide (TPR) repeat protein
VSAPIVEPGYNFAAAARILGVPEARLRYWSQSGFIGPSLRCQGRQVYSFQDLVSVRAAKELVDRGFRPAEIRKALAQVRGKLPALGRPLDKLRLTWDGSQLALVDDGVIFEVSGQRRFDFGLSDLAQRAAQVLEMTPPAGDPPPAEPARKRTAFDCFAEGLSKEGTSEGDAEAETCYRAALAADPGLAAAHTNLGAIACRRGDFTLARLEFQAALDLDSEQPEARYNLASLLYRQGELDGAASELRRVVERTPWFADAHYNLAATLEKLGSKRRAAAHLRRYLELEGANPDAAVEWLAEARARLGRLDFAGL